MRKIDPVICAFRLGLGAVLMGALLAVPASAQRPKLPPAGDCGAMVAESGGGTVWFGRFSGRYEDTFRDGFYYPVSAQGCFRSEKACRRWTNQVLSLATGSGLMSCKPYGGVN